MSATEANARTAYTETARAHEHLMRLHRAGHALQVDVDAAFQRHSEAAAALNLAIEEALGWPFGKPE